MAAGSTGWRRADVPAVDAACAALAEGGIALLIESDAPDSGADLLFAASLATPESMAFVVRHGSGLVCAALGEPDADRLGLPRMVWYADQPRGGSFAVTIDARDGITTGISAVDRTRTVRLLADPHSTAHDFTRPGHVIPIRADGAGVLGRPGRAEAALDLLTLAGAGTVGVLCRLVSEVQPTELADGDEVRDFALRHGRPLVSVEDVVAYRRAVASVAV